MYRSLGKPFVATVQVYDTHRYTEREIADAPTGSCAYTEKCHASSPEMAENEVRRFAKEFIADQKRIDDVESKKTFYLDG